MEWFASAGADSKIKMQNYICEIDKKYKYSDEYNYAAQMII